MAQAVKQVGFGAIRAFRAIHNVIEECVSARFAPYPARLCRCCIPLCDNFVIDSATGSLCSNCFRVASEAVTLSLTNSENRLHAMSHLDGAHIVSDALGADHAASAVDPLSAGAAAGDDDSDSGYEDYNRLPAHERESVPVFMSPWSLRRMVRLLETNRFRTLRKYFESMDEEVCAQGAWIPTTSATPAHMEHTADS